MKNPFSVNYKEYRISPMNNTRYNIEGLDKKGEWHLLFGNMNIKQATRFKNNEHLIKLEVMKYKATVLFIVGLLVVLIYCLTN